MALIFQERTDGYRVVKMSGDLEMMVASVRTKNQGFANSKPMTTEEFTKRVAEVGVEVALAERDGAGKTSSPMVIWEKLPLGECSIHSAGGPLSVGELEEMIDFLKS